VSTTGARLSIDARVRRGDFELVAAFTAEPGEVVGVIGENGAGKTTLLRAIAGLTPLDRGRIGLGGVTLDCDDPDVFVPPEDRPVGFVFQNYRLFPHMTVRDNVAFGPRHRRAGGRPGRRGSRLIAGEWLDRFGLAHLANRRPGELSGGQAQLVALARALAADPAILLLDEPLAALDARTRPETRAELGRHLGTFPGVTLLVTHDPVEAMAMTSRLIVLEAGRIIQDGTPHAVTRHPASPFVARLAGRPAPPADPGGEVALQ